MAIHLLAKLDKAGDKYIKGAVIENTFSSICDMADVVFGFLKYVGPLKRAMLRLKWESIEEIKHIKTPIYLISGQYD